MAQLLLHFTLSLSKSLLHWSGKIWKRHSCMNNPLKSLEGFEILTKELAGTSFCSSSYGSRGKMCTSPIINHTIQQQHCTSRPGLSPRQPDSKIPSLQMALREDLTRVCGRMLCVCVWVCVCVCNLVLLIKNSNQSACLSSSLLCMLIYECAQVQRRELITKIKK